MVRLFARVGDFLFLTADKRKGTQILSIFAKSLILADSLLISQHFSPQNHQISSENFSPQNYQLGSENFSPE